MTKKHEAPKARAVSFSAVHDENTGLVLLPLGGGRVTLAGNTISGEVYYSRVHFVDETGNFVLPAGSQLPVAWRIPEFDEVGDKVAAITRAFLFNNCKLSTALKPSETLTPQTVLDTSMRQWLPRISEGGYSLGAVGVSALESLMRVHTGQASPSETIITLEMLLAMMLALPDEFLGKQLDPDDVERWAAESDAEQEARRQGLSVAADDRTMAEGSGLILPPGVAEALKDAGK